MKPTWIAAQRNRNQGLDRGGRAGVLVALACASLALVAGAPGAQQAAPQQGGLQRVDPSRESEDPSNLNGLFARGFDRGRWKERLLEGDLEQRERSFDALLKRARLDPVARAFLEELATDQKGGELAWTARLALRELGRATMPMQGPMQGFLGADPFGSAQRMQEWMEELFGRDGFGLMVRHPSRSPVPLAGGAGTSGRSLRIEQTEHGARVLITETIDGAEKTREFQGNSLEEILAANPELEGELGGLSLRVGRGVPIGLEFDLGKRQDRLRRFPRGVQEGPGLAPQGRSLPVLTDRLGVIVRPVSAARARAGTGRPGAAGRALLRRDLRPPPGREGRGRPDRAEQGGAPHGRRHRERHACARARGRAHAGLAGRAGSAPGEDLAAGPGRT